MTKLVLPRVQAIVVCDAHKEAEDEAGVYHLNGVRAVLDVASFPAFLPRLCIFLQMSGHRGQAHCRIQIERVETGDLIYESAAKAVEFTQATTVEPVFYRLRNCVFPAPGLFYVQILHDEKLIGERPLHIRNED